jgi:phosphatidylglycerophosphate synthase
LAGYQLHAKSLRARLSQGMRAQAANLTSASRLFLAFGWVGAFLSSGRSSRLLGPIALAAAISDFLDGQIARMLGTAGGFGHWLDSVADVAFVLTVLGYEARARQIPVYIPWLIAASFAQYVADSALIYRASTPVRSRLGHLGGVINYVLVMVMSLAPAPQWPGALLDDVAPLIAIFYAAAMVERIADYRRLLTRARRHQPAKQLSQ